MKKLLLGTATFALGLSVFPINGYAKEEQSPSLKISGETQVNYYGLKQSVREGNGGKGNGHHVGVDDSRVNFELFGKTKSFGGFEYSALLGLSGNADDGNPRENRIKLKNEWGTFIAGNSRGVDDFMAVGSFSVMGATGGVTGNYDNVVNVSTGAVISKDLVGRPKDATKVSYITPRINGFQLGVSFTPSTAHKGDHKLETASPKAAKSLPFDKNQVGLGINFKETLANGLNINLSATSLFGNTQNPVRLTKLNDYPVHYHNTQSYMLGAHFKYQDWELGGEFIDNGKSRVTTHNLGTYLDSAKQGSNYNFTNKIPTRITNADAGQAYSVALGYTYGKHKWAIGYYDSTKNIQAGYNKAKANVYSATWDRKLAPGLGIYAEANYVDMKTDKKAADDQNSLKKGAKELGLSDSDLNDGIRSNKATVFVVGTKLKF
jgi:outer membrane protein OmpU